MQHNEAQQLLYSFYSMWAEREMVSYIAEMQLCQNLGLFPSCQKQY